MDDLSSAIGLFGGLSGVATAGAYALRRLSDWNASRAAERASRAAQGHAEAEARAAAARGDELDATQRTVLTQALSTQTTRLASEVDVLEERVRKLTEMVDGLKAELRGSHAERERLTRERDAAVLERDEAVTGRHAALQERDDALIAMGVWEARARAMSRELTGQIQELSSTHSVTAPAVHEFDEADTLPPTKI